MRNYSRSDKWSILLDSGSNITIMNKECPNCRRITNTSCSRLIKDTCGHTKCRMCLLYEEQGCKACNNRHHIQNIGNYDCPTINEISDDISVSQKSICNEEVVLPLELVINKDCKPKGNFELISIDCINNTEFYYKDSFDKRKETYKVTDINDASLNENLNDNLVLEKANYDKKADISNSQVETEFLKDEKLLKNKSMKCPDRNHILVIPGSPERYKCNICCKIFRNKKGKCYHDACVTGVRPYECTFCDRTFVKRSHFEYHERVHRGYKPFKCRLCEKAFPQRNKLNRHMYSHCNKKQFVCPKCNKGYTKREDLKNHLGMHHGSTTYSCHACEKTFRILTNLKRHIKTHTNERPHVCDQCDKSFKDKSLLIRHKRTHGKDRPFSCADCSRVFLSKSELRRHLTVHSDEKPFSCKYCQTVFRRKDNLHRHIRHHHLENPCIDINKVENGVSGTGTKSVKAYLTNSKQKQKPKKTQKGALNSLSKSPAKVSVVCMNSHDQICSRLDSMGNITPVIRTTSEVSNAVPVINGPINIKKSEDKTDARKKTFTYTEPIPLAEAVVINRRIEEKLYPQNVSNHNYFFRNCFNCVDKSVFANQTSRINCNLKNSVVNSVELATSVKDLDVEKQIANDSKRIVDNSTEKANCIPIKMIKKHALQQFESAVEMVSSNDKKAETISNATLPTKSYEKKQSDVHWRRRTAETLKPRNQ